MKGLVVHKNKPEWGYGLVFHEDQSYCYVVFEEGNRKKIAREAEGLLEEVTLADDEADVVQAKLRRLAEKTVPSPRTKTASVRDSKAPAPAVMSFGEQVQLFKAMFPKGFEDERFIREERGLADAGGSTKYKQRAIEEAQRLLARTVLEDAIQRGDYKLVRDNALKVLGRAENLVHWLSDTGPFKRLDESRFEPFARALYAVLHGGGELAPRFEALVESLGPDDPTWSLTTAFLALADPERFFFVRPTHAEQQAAILSVESGRKKRPDGHVYEKFLSMATNLRERLKAGGLNPRDLMDVYSFSWTTLSSKSDTDAAIPTA